MGPYQIFYALTGILLVALPICNCLQALLPQSPLLEPLRGPDDADNLPANNSRPKEIRAAVSYLRKALFGVVFLHLQHFAKLPFW